MVEVIHRFHNSYPFGLDKETQNTFTLILKENLSEKEISLYRQKNKILKEISNNSLIKLVRLLKEDNKLHLLYEYYPLSLNKYIEIVKNQAKTQRQKCRALSTEYNTTLDQIIEEFIKAEIKADIFLWNIAVVPKGKEGVKLKVFIEPQAEFLTLIEHHYQPKENKRKETSLNNQQFLQQFYEGERKRLNIEFQQLLEHHFGKTQEHEKKSTPNFVINGTKLLFINSNPAKEEIVNTKSSKIQNNKPKQTKEKAVQDKGKNEKEQNQAVSTPLMKDKQMTGSQKKVQQAQQKKKIQKIVNFDQSFQPQFKPEEFTKENTYILEEHDYLQSLQQQLQKLSSQKKLQPNAPTKQLKTANSEKIKEGSTNEQKKMTASQKYIENIQETSKASNTQNSSSSINQNQNNSNASSHQDNEGQKMQICKIQPKDTAVIEEKVFKYKMKIITSHEIQIQGDGQPNVEQIQRQIMEGIKTGKLNINDLAANKRAPTQNRSAEMNNSNESSKEVIMSGSTYTQKSAPAANFFKDNGAKIVQSTHESSKRESNLNHNPQILQTRTSDLQQAKLKTINQIIEKIGIKTNQPQNQELKQSKPSTGLSSGSHQEEYKSSSLNTASIPQYKTEKIDINQQKMEKAENYRNKIREAKQKAQLLLRQYAKKKQ